MTWTIAGSVEPDQCQLWGSALLSEKNVIVSLFVSFPGSWYFKLHLAYYLGMVVTVGFPYDLVSFLLLCMFFYLVRFLERKCDTLLYCGLIDLIGGYPECCKKNWVLNEIPSAC